jgi:(S)-2-hydroxyglutarate dehydrogenase
VELLEKEPACGMHASGRNSGVLHAGFYYSSDSFKARFTRDGNRRMAAYCDEKGLPINRCGKLVVARSEEELETLGDLYRQGQVNGVELEMVSDSEARDIEPRLGPSWGAMFSPATATVDPRKIMISLANDLRASGGGIRTSDGFAGYRNGEVISTGGGVYQPGYIVNAAGLYADRVAKQFGFAQELRIIPFKGRYIEGPPTQNLRTNVYPVPDPRMPVLGLHFTVTVAGGVTIGPTAFPAAWREQYGGMSNFRPGELADVFRTQASLWLKNEAGFRSHVRTEFVKLSKKKLVSMASSLIPDLGAGGDWTWGKTGIRAQLFNEKTRTLEMDFLFRADSRSLHVLNAVSPAFTSSFSLSEHLVDQIPAL